MADAFFSAYLRDKFGAPKGEMRNFMKSLTFTRTLNLPASATVEVNMDDPLYSYCRVDYECQMSVHRPPKTTAETWDTSYQSLSSPSLDRVIQFYGNLPEYGIEEDAESGIAKLTFQDPRWYWNDAYMSFSGYPQIYSGTMDLAISTTLSVSAKANRYNSKWAALHGSDVVNTFNAPGFLVQLGTNLSQLVDTITKLEGGPDVDMEPFDWYYNIMHSEPFYRWNPRAATLSNPVGGGTTTGLYVPIFLGGVFANFMGTLKIMAQQGVARPEIHFIYGQGLTGTGSPAGLPGNVKGMKRSFAKMVNDVTVSGTDAVTGLASQQNYTTAYSGGQNLALFPTLSAGMRSEWVTSSDQQTAAQMLTQARGRVLSRQWPVSVITIDTPSNEFFKPFVDYDIGDTVYCSCRRGGMFFERSPLRIQQITVTQDENGVLTNTQITAAGVV